MPRCPTGCQESQRQVPTAEASRAERTIGPRPSSSGRTKHGEGQTKRGTFPLVLSLSPPPSTQLPASLPCLESHAAPSSSPGSPGPGPPVATHLAIGVSLDLGHADALPCQSCSERAASAHSRIPLLCQRGSDHPWALGGDPGEPRQKRPFCGRGPEPHTHNPAQLMETHSALVLLQTLVTGTASPLGPNASLFCPETHKGNAGGSAR